MLTHDIMRAPCHGGGLRFVLALPLPLFDARLRCRVDARCSARTFSLTWW
jgi:hypothetical protein